MTAVIAILALIILVGVLWAVAHKDKATDGKGGGGFINDLHHDIDKTNDYMDNKKE